MELKGKHVLVTGATGTVGSRIVPRLLHEGARVRALVRRRGPIEELSGAELVHGDLAEATSLGEVVAGMDAVVHTAAYIEFGDPTTNWETARAVNVEGTRVLAEAALAHGVRRFVHFSTCGAYDPQSSDIEVDEQGRLMLFENAPLWTEVDDAYSQSKADAERVLWEIAERGLAVTVLRPPAVFGVHPSSHWGSHMVDAVRRGTSMGLPRMHLNHWTHAENLAEMTIVVLREPAAAGERYNAADGTFRTHEFMGPVAQWLGVEYPVSPDFETPDRTYISGKVQALGYSPVIGFEDAMAEIEAHVRAAV